MILLEDRNSKTRIKPQSCLWFVRNILIMTHWEKLQMNIWLKKNQAQNRKEETLLPCVLDCFSYAQLFATLWTLICRDPLSMGFSRQEYWHGLSYPPLGVPPNLGIEPVSLMSPVLAGRFFTTRTTWEANCCHRKLNFRLMEVKTLWSRI